MVKNFQFEEKRRNSGRRLQTFYDPYLEMAFDFSKWIPPKGKRLIDVINEEYFEERKNEEKKKDSYNPFD